MKKLLCFQHLKAGHDSNGNPRRCFVGYDKKGNIAIVADEGYSGRPGWTNGVVELPSVNVSFSEYRAFLNAVKLRVKGAIHAGE